MFIVRGLKNKDKASRGSLFFLIQIQLIIIKLQLQNLLNQSMPFYMMTIAFWLG